MIEETGVGIKNPLWFVGVVENRNDPRKEGRVQVRAFSVHGTNAQVPTESLPWAVCISGSYDPNYPIPPLNAWVFGFFIDGRDAQQPMILGLIPTQMTGLIDPVANGWGVIPTENVNLNSQGSRAIDYGQPSNSRKARGEDIQNTDILFQEVNRLSADFSSIEEGLTINEPVPGYNAVYPYNRVIETAGGHSIELDDSPGGERIRIWHSKGAFVEMHQSGAMVIKASNDLWLGAEGNICIVSKTQQYIKVEGDAVMSVDGNMALEVNGDMRHTVGGNYELSVGGQLNLNGSEEIQARGAKVRIEANVEGVNIKAAKNVSMQSGEAFNIKSGIGINQQAVGDINVKSENLYIQGVASFNLKAENILQEATADINVKGVNLFVESTGTFNLKSASNINAESAESINIKSGVGIFQEAAGDINIKGANLFAQSSGTFNLKSSAMFLEATGTSNIKASHVKIGGGTKVSINSAVVAIDDIIQLASSNSAPPVPASDAIAADAAEAATPAEEALPTPPTESTELPEPVAKSSGNGNGSGSYSAGYKGSSMAGTGGYMSNDDTDSGSPMSASSVFEGPSDFIKGDYADLESALRAQGFTENEILAALAIVGGESRGNFAAVETGYSTTSNDRIRSIFSKTRSLTDAELNNIKSSDVSFFNYIYGGSFGNSATNNDGYDYRGRTFIQLTFKANYQRYASITGLDIVNNPALLNTDRGAAASVTAAYLKDRVKRTGDPVSDIRTAVAGTSTGKGYTMNIAADRARYKALVESRGTMV